MARGSKGGWLLAGGAALLLLMAGKKVLGFAVKPGAVLPTTQQMNYVLDVVTRVWSRYGRMATVTSGTDGVHSANSSHYDGLALDFRTKDIDNINTKRAMVEEVRDILGRDYFVLFEDEGLPNEHLHIEYRPRS